MWTEDTSVRILTRGKKGGYQGRFWTYVRDDEHAYPAYDFTINRNRDGPQSFLQDFRGWLYADAYARCGTIFLGSRNDRFSGTPIRSHQTVHEKIIANIF
jgi:hypothetical protein